MKTTKATQNALKRFVKRNIANTTIATLLCFSVIGVSWLFNNADTLIPKVAIEVAISETNTLTEVRCIDGDTFAYGETTIRMLAIDTPETVKPNSPVEPYGKEASDFTCALLTEAQVITLKQDVGNEVDKYGRMLAWVYVDGILLQETLVNEGLAQIKYVDKKTVDYENLQLLEVKQAEAKSKKQ